MTEVIWAALLGPAGLLMVAALPGRRVTAATVARAASTASILSLLSAVGVATAVGMFGVLYSQPLGAPEIGAGLYVDALSAGMLLLVSFIGFIVIRYSRNYLRGNPRQASFIKGLGAVVAMVQILVISGNLLAFIAAWIATSLFLNRLLLFYPDRPLAVLAARKKFVVSRIGDLCLIAGAACLYIAFQTLDFRSLFEAFGQPGYSIPLQAAASLLFVVAALLKSAQFPLHGWMLEVMETPTPVSALLHAGVVNAGGFLIIRFSDLISQSSPALNTMAIVGGASALFGSLVMLTQTSIKVSLAYSTIAQMGFMLLQCGLGAFSAAFLHIIAHSLYKAHAFLSSGSLVERLRAEGAATTKAHPARLAMAFGLAVAVTGGIGYLFGATLWSKPGVFVLGAVLAMSITLLLANGLGQKLGAAGFGRVLTAAVGVSTSYFLLQAGAEMILKGSVAADAPALAGPMSLGIAALVIVSFGLVTWLQGNLALVSSSAWGRTLYVHLSHGLYINTIANSLAVRFGRLRRPA